MDLFTNRNISIIKSALNNEIISYSITKFNTSLFNSNITPLFNKLFGIRYLHIKPLKDSIIKLDSISTLDVETINYNDIQIPVTVSIAFNFTKSKLFLINPNIFYKDIDLAVKLL
jgi:hypothetical protein